MHVAEVMTSLANVIKSVSKEIKEAKVITLRTAIRPVEKEPNIEIDRQKMEQIENELIQEAKEKANSLLKQAEEEINKKIEALKKEEDSLQEKISAAMEDARVKGYDEGFQLGRKDGEQSMHNLIEEVRQLVDASREEYVKKLAEAEPMMIKIAIALAEKIVGNNLEEQPERWSHVVKTAVKEVKEHENIKIFVHPSKYERTLNDKKTFKAALNESTDIYIYPNEELAEDACMIETSFGTIDASIDTQITEIKKQLLEIVEEKQNE